MKKLLSILLVAVMVAAMFVPITVSATEPAAQSGTSSYGTLAFEENFDDPTKIDTWKAPQLGAETEIENLSIDTQTGVLNFDTALIPRGAVSAPRLKMYTVPYGVSEFTVVVKFKADNTSEIFGLIIADKLTDKALPEANTKNDTTMQLFWARPKSTHADGIRTYINGESQQTHKNDTDNFYEAGEWHEITITVDLTTNTGKSTLAKWNGSEFVAYTQMNEKTFDYYAIEGMRPNIGLLSKDADVYVDYLKVYTKADEGNLIHSNDFSTMPADDKFYGYACKQGAYTKSIDNGNLRIVSNAKAGSNTIYGRYGARVNLWEFNPNQYGSMKVSLDLTINNYVENATLSSAGPALILGDNLVSDTAHNGTDSIFQMVWLRPYTKGTSGVYNYGGTAGGQTVNKNIEGIAGVGSFNITVYIPNTADNTNKIAYFIITNKQTGQFYDGNFIYKNNGGDIKNIIGLYINHTDVTFEDLKVWSKDSTTTELTGATMSIGTDLSMNVFATINNAHLTATPKVRFTTDAKSIVVEGAKVGGYNTYKFVFPEMPPQCLGESIKAELICDNTFVDEIESFSAKSYLERVIADEDSTADEKALAEATLVYGGAAQEYLNKTDTISGEYDLPESIESPNKAAPVRTGDKILAAGLYFDYTNKIYFRFNIEGVTKITISDGVNTLEYTDTDIATKIYTRELYASELSNVNFTVKVYTTDADNPDSTITYGVYNYITNKWASTTNIAGLVKALYNYAECAKALAN